MSKRIPSYRQHKPSGQAVVTLNGKDHYLGPWDSKTSRIEYDRLIAEWLANGRRLPQDSKEEISIVELIVDYLIFAKEYYSAEPGSTSEYSCLKEALRPVRKLYGETMADDFGPLALKAVRQTMIDDGWCRTHINRQINRVRRVFRWGIENELVSPNVIQGLTAVAALKKGRTEARESDPVRPVCDEDVDAVLPHVAPQIAAMIQLQLLTAMRPGEVVKMRPSDIRREGDVWIYQPAHHKTAYRGKLREIYIGPKAQRILDPWLVRDPETFCFSPIEAENLRNAKRRTARNTAISKGSNGRKQKTNSRLKNRYDVNSYRRAIQYAIEKHSLTKWHPNQLRHSRGTKIREQFGLDVAQVILGHATADVTQVYAEANRKKATEIVKIVG
ncbi:MAG: site-specific integrase [bacterium]|nr:site-specific integrase [bacterium]